MRCDGWPVFTGRNTIVDAAAMPPRHRRALVFASIVAIAALCAATPAVVHFRAEAAWTRMDERAAELDEAWQRQDHRREPLYGAATEGSAFAGYAEALALAKTLSSDQNELMAMLPHKDDGRVAVTQALRERWRPALNALRAAAHCADARPPRPTPPTPEHSLQNLLTSRWLVNMAVLESRACRLAGDPEAAVAWSLDAATLGVDFMRSGLLVNQMIGAALVQIATVEAWPDRALRQLDATALERLAQGLERLDAVLPMTTDAHGDLRYFSAWLESPREPEDEGSFPSTWRYGFSTRWIVADAYLRAARLYDQLAAPAEGAWPQRETRLQAALTDLAATNNPMLVDMVPNLTSAEFGLRQVVAHVRLLRMAVAMHRGLDEAPLRDPLGDGPLLVVREAEGVTLRSAGTTANRKIERRVER